MENNTQAVAKQETKQLMTISTQLIKNEIPVKSCSEVELKQCLGYGMILSGLSVQNMPSKTESAILSNFIRNNYPDYTPEEIKYVMEMAMARRFGLDIDVKCYGSFSCEYIGRIFQAYEKWNGETVQGLEYWQYESQDCLRGTIQSLYEAFLRGYTHSSYPTRIYYPLVNDGYLKRLSGPKAKRVYPKQMEILRAFKTAAERGMKALYIPKSKTVENG